MPQFGKKSRERRDTCDYRIRSILDEAIQVYDFSVLCGYRDEEEQDKAVREGHSQVDYPNSKHNTNPSLAVDIAPYPIDWEDRERFILLAGIITGIAHQKGYVIRWGGAWNGLSTMRKNKFNDLVHFEIID